MVLSKAEKKFTQKLIKNDLCVRMKMHAISDIVFPKRNSRQQFALKYIDSCEFWNKALSYYFN